MAASTGKEALRRAKFLFDLNGYCVVRGVLSESEILQARESIDKHKSEFKERKGSVLRNSTAAKETKISGDGSTGRFDLGGILSWKDGCSKIFKRLLCHEKLVPYLHLLLGEGYRLDHDPFVIKQIHGSEGFNLHGGPCRSLQYSCSMVILTLFLENQRLFIIVALRRNPQYFAWSFVFYQPTDERRWWVLCCQRFT